MRRLFKNISEYNLEEKISLVLLLSGLTLSLIGFITNLLFEMPFNQNWPNLVVVIYLASILYFFHQKIYEVSRITILLIGFLYFPYLFFHSNGHLGAGPIYFLMIIVYIAFFLKGKGLGFTLFILISFYMTLIVASYLNPGMTIPYNDQITRLIDISIAFISVSIVVSLIGYVVFKEYNQERLTIQKLMRELKIQNVELERTSMLDPLSKVYNRRFFMNTLDQLLLEDKPVHAIMIDIDHFKQINDTYGHLFGDQVLEKVAGSIVNSTREQDVVARYGGEEFCVIISEQEFKGCVEIAERIRSNIELLQFEHDITITVSVGAACNNPDDTSLSILKRADDNLYIAKETGRNKVVAK